jgi:hypothetical protein
MSMSMVSTAALGVVSSGWRIGSFGGHLQNPAFSELPGKERAADPWGREPVRQLRWRGFLSE